MVDFGIIKGNLIALYINKNRHKLPLIVLVVFMALTAGVIAATGKPILVALFACLMIALFTATSKKALLWLAIIGGIVISGIAQLYYPDMKYVRFIIPLASVALFLHVDFLRSQHIRSVSTFRDNKLFWLLVAFLVFTIFSSLVNWDGVGGFVLGLKLYFQVFGLFFALYLIDWKRADIEIIPKVLFLIALLQLPFVLHQYLFLVPERISMGSAVPVDIVTGTFGGGILGGGANSVLATFLITVVSVLLGLWKQKLLTGLKTFLLSTILMSPIFVNETKISVVYLLLVVIVLFYKDIVKHPKRFFTIGILSGVFLVILMSVMAMLHTSKKVHNVIDLIVFTYNGQVGSLEERKGMYYELTRWTSLTFWLSEHNKANLVEILIGHGPGAARVQSHGLGLTETLAERKYSGLRIGVTAISILLWETGIFGVLLIIAIFIVAFRITGRLAIIYQKDPYKAGIFDGLRGCVAMLSLGLFYGDYFVFHLPYQTFVLLVFGYISYWWLRRREYST